MAFGVSGGDQPEISLDGSSPQSDLSESSDAVIVTVDSASSDTPSPASSSLALASSSSPALVSSSLALSSQSSVATRQFRCMYQDGTSDAYTEQVDGRSVFFKCLNGTKCFHAPSAPSRIRCDYASSASASGGQPRQVGPPTPTRTVTNVLDPGKHYFAQADAEASLDTISMSTVSLDLPLAGIPTSSEPKVISLNIILPTIAIRITEDSDAPNIATVISIDAISDSTSSSATENVPTKVLTRMAIETPGPRLLTVTATVMATTALSPPALPTSILSITASSDMTQFTQSMINRFTSEDSLLTDKPRHAITINGLELSSIVRQPSPSPTTTTVYLPASSSTPELRLVGTFFSVQPTQQASQQRASVVPSSVQREYNLPPTPPPMMSADTTTSPMVFQGSNFYDPPSPSPEMDVPPVTGPVFRPPKLSLPTYSPAPIPPPQSSTQILYPQNTPTVWLPPSRVAAPTTPHSMPQTPLPLPQAPQPMPQPIPQAPQPDSMQPLITVVMHPNSGMYPIPVSSYPFGMSPLHMAPAPPVNTRAPAPNTPLSIEEQPASDTASAGSQNTPIIPFITNGARQSASANMPYSPSKAKAGEINAHGIVSVLQEVFHIPPTAISIDGTPIAIADVGAKDGKGAVTGGKNKKHGDDDNDNDDDSDNDVQDNGEHEQDLESDSRFNIGEIARSRRKVRSKIKAVGRLVKTLTKKEDHEDSDEGDSNASDDNSNDDSDPAAQTPTALSTLAKNSAEAISNISTSMNLASHGATLLSVVMPDTTLSAPVKVAQATDDDSMVSRQSDDS
ncbi:hypothetical protein IWW37_002067 [Coemansia sp. RSA 2050]|nr:hypothetical protein IWW37_002067 [Coemansia sp. RSA 2050]